jgi:hypothetical protein
MRNAVAIADLSEASAKVLVSPSAYADKTLSFNGPLVCCEMAATAFSEAFGRVISYEQVAYDVYNTSLMHSFMQEWQADGLMEMFRLFDAKAPFCQQGCTELESILGREPTNIFQLAKIAVDKILSGGRGIDNEGGAIVDPLKEVLFPLSPRAVLHTASSAENFRMDNFSNQAPPGLCGSLNMTLARQEDLLRGTNLRELKCGARYCLLLGGIFTYSSVSSAAACLSTEGGLAKPISSIENSSLQLAGYILERESATRLCLRGSSGEEVFIYLDASSESEAGKWQDAIMEHVEFVDNSRRSKWIF